MSRKQLYVDLALHEQWQVNVNKVVGNFGFSCSAFIEQSLPQAAPAEAS